jgi:NAD(P)H-hydrate epimerase
MIEGVFRDDRGRSVPAVTGAEMLEIDRIAVEETGPSLYQMMENAGRNLAGVARAMLGDDWRTGRIVVLAGTGGNGGGGITAGRHLLNHGARVAAAITDASRLGEVPAQQLEVFRHAGGAVLASLPDSADLIVDALIGYSLRGAPRGRALELIEWANGAAAPVLSLDVPSGIDATTGEALGAAVAATRTMTLALPKLGLRSRNAGVLDLADIGIPREVYLRMGAPTGAEVFDGRYRVPLQRNLSTDE